MRKNPYRPLTPEEKLSQEAVALKIKAEVKAVAELGKKCLDNPLFKKYQDRSKQCKELILKAMKENTEPDPIKYALFMKACISKIDVLDMLLEDITKDAKKEPR